MTLAEKLKEKQKTIGYSRTKKLADRLALRIFKYTSSDDYLYKFRDSALIINDYQGIFLKLLEE